MPLRTPLTWGLLPAYDRGWFSPPVDAHTRFNTLFRLSRWVQGASDYRFQHSIPDTLNSLQQLRGTGVEKLGWSMLGAV